MVASESDSITFQKVNSTPVKSTEKPTVMGMKSSTFWWITAGVAALIIGGTVAALSKGGSSGSNSSTQTGSVAVHWW